MIHTASTTKTTQSPHQPKKTVRQDKGANKIDIQKNTHTNTTKWIKHRNQLLQMMNDKRKTDNNIERKKSKVCWLGFETKHCHSYVTFKKAFLTNTWVRTHTLHGTDKTSKRTQTNNEDGVQIFCTDNVVEYTPTQCEK